MLIIVSSHLVFTPFQWLERTEVVFISLIWSIVLKGSFSETLFPYLVQRNVNPPVFPLSFDKNFLPNPVLRPKNGGT